MKAARTIMTARRMMSTYLLVVRSSIFNVLPPAAYQQLALRKPAAMLAPIARALIISDYRDT